MKMDELDLIEEVHQVRINNKEELIKEILKKSEESEFDILKLCSVVNLYIAQSMVRSEVEIPLRIIKDLE